MFRCPNCLRNKNPLAAVLLTRAAAASGILFIFLPINQALPGGIPRHFYGYLPAMRTTRLYMMYWMARITSRYTGSMAMPAKLDSRPNRGGMTLVPT